MNICFFIGKIISDIDFKFIVNSKKYYSISILQIELNNKSIVTVKGYNDIADFCYQKLEKGKFYIVPGIDIKLAKIGIKLAPTTLVSKVTYHIQKRKLLNYMKIHMITKYLLQIKFIIFQYLIMDEILELIFT